MNKDSHAAYLAKECVRNVQKGWGKDALHKLGPIIFQGLVAREVVYVILAQALDMPSTTESIKASAAEHMQEVARIAMSLADPDMEG